MLKLTVNLDTDLNLDIGTIRAPRAIREIKIFLTKHMKASDVKIDESINHAIWERGIQKIPSKITVKAVKDDDGVVKATLAE